MTRGQGEETGGQLDKTTEKLARATIEEARMVLPGIQALFGFQLIAVFNERFKGLSEGEQLIHLAAAVLIAVAIALIMTPAAYHRQVERATVSSFFVAFASRLITTAMVPLMLGLCLEMYLLGRLIVGNVALSMVVAGGLLATFAGLWFVLPWFMARRRAGKG
jgi:hypothetical protein